MKVVSPLTECEKEGGFVVASVVALVVVSSVVAWVVVSTGTSSGSVSLLDQIPAPIPIPIPIESTATLVQL